MSLRWPSKDPDEVLDYDIDWTVRLYSPTELVAYQAQVDAGIPISIVPADTILSSVFTVPAGIVANSSTFTTRATKVWLSGGADLSSYDVLNRIVTAGGRTMDQTVKLKIKTK